MLEDSTVVCHFPGGEKNTSISGMDCMLVTVGCIVLLAQELFTKDVWGFFRWF